MVWKWEVRLQYCNGGGGKELEGGGGSGIMAAERHSMGDDRKW
jgi:hypothetical protein